MGESVAMLMAENGTAGRPPRHVASLDGIRGLCCLAVIGHHFGFPGFIAGWIGVEMFFVLSGFLITTLLYREYEQTGTLSLTNFWLRRAFRLLPIYWLYATFLTVALLLRSPGDFHREGAWTPNLFIASIWAYFINLSPSHLWKHQLWAAQLWSLAKEEQFYLCWPVILFLVGRQIAWMWLLPLALALLGMTAGISGSWSGLVAYTPLGITAGCTVAMLLSVSRETSAARWIASSTARWIFAIISVAILSVLEWRTLRLGDDAVRPWAFHVIVPLYSFPFALLVASLWYGQADILGRCLSIRPLTYIGIISYGIYIYHIALIAPVKSFAAEIELHSGIHVRFAIVIVFYLVAVLGIASISYFLIELPLLRIGKRFRPRVESAKATQLFRTNTDEMPKAVLADISAELIGIAD